MSYELDGGDYPIPTINEALEDVFDADEYIQWLISTGRVPQLYDC